MIKASELFDLKDKVAIVTGGSRGLGNKLALGLAEFGAKIVVADINDEEIKNMRKRINDLLFIETNVTNKKAVERMVTETKKTMGRIDILVNNAGISIRSAAENFTEEEWCKVIDVNLNGAFFVAQAVGKVMIEQGFGNIINIASVVGQRGLYHPHDFSVAYCCSKGGVIQLTKALAVEWACHKIRVNAVAPTYLRTDLVKELFGDKDFKEYIYNKIPLGRLVNPEEIIGSVVFLASEASSMVTGHILNIDGGWLAV